MKKVVVLAIAVASLAFAATALAGSKTIAQSGQMVGDKATSVKLRIKVKDGEPIKVSGFEAKDVFTRCKGDVVRFTYTALDPLPVINDKFKIKLVGSGGAVMKVAGKVKDNGRSTSGSLKTNNFNNDGVTCKTPKQRFKTSK